MARYAATTLQWTGVIGLPAGAALTIQLGATPRRFEVGPQDTVVGTTVYFTQRYTNTPNSGLVDAGFANASHLEDVLRGNLNTLDYEVVCTYYPLQVADPDDPSSTGQPHTLRLTITARAFGDAYNFPAVTVSGNFPPHTQRLVASQPAPTFTAEATELLCFGQRTGRLAVSGLQGGVPPYAISWADTPTTDLLRENLGPGTYELTVRDSAGPDPADYDNTYDTVPGVVTRTFLLRENSRLNVSVRKEDTSVQLTVSGGTAPYAFLWDDGATTAQRANLAAGTYYCVVTDAANCAAETVEVRIDSYSFHFSRNSILLALDAGAAYRLDPSTKPGLTFICDVFIEPEYRSGNFVPVGVRLEQPADRDGRTEFEVQELLDVFLDHHVPAVGQAAVSLAAPLFRRFYLEHAEVYGEPPVPAPATTLTQHYLLKGGLSRYEAETRTYLERYRPQVKPFLTWQPNYKVVFADQPEFLYYHSNQVARTDIALRCRVFFSDGSSRLLPLGPLTTDVLRYEVCCCPVGFEQLGLSDEPSRHVVRWTVWVGDDYDAVYSEQRTYVLDREPQPQRRYLLFANSLGGMDTLCVWGDAQLDAEVTGEELERSPGPRYDVLLGDQLVLDRTLRPVLKLASGLRAESREWMTWAQELLLSRRVLLLNGPRWLPGVVKAKTIALFKEGEWHQTLEIDFQLPREQHYTPRLGTAAVTRQDLLLP